MRSATQVTARHPDRPVHHAAGGRHARRAAGIAAHSERHRLELGHRRWADQDHVTSTARAWSSMVRAAHQRMHSGARAAARPTALSPGRRDLCMGLEDGRGRRRRRTRQTPSRRNRGVRQREGRRPRPRSRGDPAFRRLLEPVQVAGLLHDVVEDTAWTVDDIAARFGSSVAGLVGALTEDGRIEATAGASTHCGTRSPPPGRPRRTSRSRTRSPACAICASPVAGCRSASARTTATLAVAAETAQRRLANEVADLLAALAERDAST